MAADSSREPAWFVQLTAAGEEPKQDGPITLQELLKRIKKKQLIGDDYVWTPGMENWAQIQEIKNLRDALPDPTLLTDPSLPKKFAGKLPVLSEFTMDSTRFSEKRSSSDPVGVELETRSDIIKPGTLGSLSPASTWPTSRGEARSSTSERIQNATSQNPLLKAIGLSALIGVCFYIIFGQFNPAVLISEELWAKLFVRFPALADVADEDYVQLKESATKLLFVSGPRIAIAPARTRGENLSLYLATNLSYESTFEVYLQGDQDTLAGDSVQIPPLKLSIGGVLTRTPPVAAPEGYYWVHVFAGKTQPKRTGQLLASLPSAIPMISSKSFPTNQKLLIAKKLFLGGSPDLNYQGRLKDYFSNRRGKALAELDSIKDALLLIEDRLASENKAARALISLPNQPARAKAWSIYESSWSPDAETLEKFSKANFHFYQQTQAQAQSIVQTLFQLHTLHSWLTKPSLEEELKHGASSKLNTATVEVASIIVNGDTTSNTIHTKLQALKLRVESLIKDAENPNTQIQEEVSPPAPKL